MPRTLAGKGPFRQAGSMKDRQGEAAYVAKAIAAFLNGTGGERDWEDFTSFRLHDRTLDSIASEP